MTVNVLFVDDEPAILRAFRRSLDGRGVAIDTTASVGEALRLLGEREFAVIASDFRMPEMNGADFFRRCRQITPDSRRILVTGMCDFDVATRAVNDGAVDMILSKPWDSEKLWSAVQQGAEHFHLVRENRRLQGELASANRELEARVQARTSQVLAALVTALDLRDTETRWHSRRVAAYTRRLAEQLGVTGDDLVDIERGALLHDIGKIGVRDAVLLKPGRLTPEEWVEMERHPELGYHMLEEIDFLSRARLIPLQHQERWDGKGYPKGLAGEDICLGARCFAVADTLDAITSDRPYRKARSFAVARQEIVRCAGTQFDPAVVAAFLEVPTDQWRAIRAEFAHGEGSVPPDDEPPAADAA